MKYKKVLLVNPPYSGARVKVVFCAGLGYIAEILKCSGIGHEVLDMSLGYPYKILKNKIDVFQPDLIGISMMTYRYKETYALIERIKKDYPEIAVVAGGPHVSLLREKVLLDCSGIDYGVVLEGEETLPELCAGAAPASVKGLIRRQGRDVVYNGDRPFIQNLDGIPFPKYEKFDLQKSFQKGINALPVVSSRGCPFSCIYCPVQCSIGGVFRQRSPEHILGELDYWYGQGYRRFSFADDNFTLVKERVYKICELLRAGNRKDMVLSCDNGIRADKVDKELLGVMRESGFSRVAFGVEAGNDKVLKMLKKSERISTIRQRIADACALGYEVDLFFLVGSPGETRADIEDSFKIVSEFPAGTAYFYNIIPFPHTELFAWIENNGRFLKKPDDYLHDYPILDNAPVFETDDFPLKERRKALSAAFALMRRTMRRSWQNRLSRFGIIGRLLAAVYTAKLTQDVMLRNKVLRKMVYAAGQKLFS